MGWNPRPHPRPRRRLDPALGPQFYGQGSALMVTTPAAPAANPVAGLPVAYCLDAEMAEDLATMLNDACDYAREKLAEAEEKVT